MQDEAYATIKEFHIGKNFCFQASETCAVLSRNEYGIGRKI